MWVKDLSLHEPKPTNGFTVWDLSGINLNHNHLQLSETEARVQVYLFLVESDCAPQQLCLPHSSLHSFPDCSRLSRFKSVFFCFLFPFPPFPRKWGSIIIIVGQDHHSQAFLRLRVSDYDTWKRMFFRKGRTEQAKRSRTAGTENLQLPLPWFCEAVALLCLRLKDGSVLKVFKTFTSQKVAALWRTELRTERRSAVFSRHFSYFPFWGCS